MLRVSTVPRMCFPINRVNEWVGPQQPLRVRPSLQPRLGTGLHHGVGPEASDKFVRCPISSFFFNHRTMAGGICSIFICPFFIIVEPLSMTLKFALVYMGSINASGGATTSREDTSSGGASIYGATIAGGTVNTGGATWAECTNLFRV